MDDRDIVVLGEENRLRRSLRSVVEAIALLLLVGGSVAFWVRFSSVVYHSRANDSYSEVKNVSTDSRAAAPKDW